MTQQPIGNNVPLRLADALAIAFPMGGMTVSGLRRERDKGNLVVERIAGKEFVTLAAIDDMRAKCRDERKPRAASPLSKTTRFHQGTTLTDHASVAQAAALATLNKLSESLGATAEKATAQVSHLALASISPGVNVLA